MGKRHYTNMHNSKKIAMKGKYYGNKIPRASF